MRKFGTGHLTEATIKDLAKAELFVPEDMRDAIDQLAVVIRLLDLLTGRKSIASEAYRHGRDFILGRRREFDKAVRNDRLFMAKFLYMLDRIFQKFCHKLLQESRRSKNPILRAGRKLKGYQAASLDFEMRSFDTVGSTPPLGLPSIIEEGALPPPRNQNRATGDPVRSSKREDQVRGAETKDRTKGGATNEEVVPGWRLPAGKSFSDLFGKAHQANRSGFPKVPHHNPAKKGATKPCLSWHLDGQCGRKDACFASHVPAADLPPELKAKIDEQLRRVYT